MDTPARRQYLDLKARHPDAILWFRMGDFYETFDSDAEVMARDLHITLTSREFGKGNRVPMAGVPHHAATSYLRRLLAKGHRVAICEQLTEAGNGLVERDVVRVITPGTIVEPNLLTAQENNYLAALLPGREGVGLAWLDVTTGEFAVAQFTHEQTATLAAELTRLDPAECLVPEGKDLPVVLACPLAPCPQRWFHEPSARERLQSRFGVVSLEPYGCADLRLAIGAAGAALAYVETANRDLVRLLRGLRTETPGTYMTLDPATRRNLDLTRSARQGNRTGTLLHVLDRTRTPMGGRLLRRWLGAPLLDLAQLARRHDTVAALVAYPAARVRLQSALDGAGDLERTAARARQGIAAARDLLGVASGLRAADAVGEVVIGLNLTVLPHPPTPSPNALGEGEPNPDSLRFDTAPPSLAGKGAGGLGLLNQTAIITSEAPLSLRVGRGAGGEGLLSLITRAISADPDRRINPGFDVDLDAVQSTVADAQATMLGLERQLRERSGIKSLKVGYNKVVGYYIEVTRANLAHVPTDFIRRQTLSNAERYVTDDLRECEAAILRAEEGIAALEDAVFCRVRAAVAAEIGPLLETAAWLAELDVLAAFAEVATERRYVRPVLDTSGVLEITGGRHPVVEASLSDGAFIANDCALDLADARLLLITGPNMAGKSTYLRQVALTVLMAQVGSFVPAAAARIGVVDRIFTRVGAHDDLAAGASTFLVEMVETAAILRHATDRSLLVFDEIGRGTSTLDGLSIAQAVAEDVHDRIGARTLFATHYHELIALAERLPHLRNANAAAVEEGGRVVFLHRIRPGGADRSYGIHVAQIAGLPEHVTERARTLLAEAEAGVQSSEAPASASNSELRTPNTELVSRLRAVDLARTTPLDALNLLAALQEQATAEATPTQPLRLVREGRPPDSAFRIPHSAL